MKWTCAAGATILLLALPAAAEAQSAGASGTGQFQAGYGGARYTTARAQTGSTRDANHNRLVVNGLIQTGVGSYSRSTGASAASVFGEGSDGRSTIGGATAIGNNLNVVVQGNNNTVVVTSTQTNTGNVTARTSLNGTLNLP
ncbi:holdfast anchoring protein HfaA [Chrysosporum bergii ANA360D]|uniref:Holdfast anchoring protein HfaA n=1 Tax=Chrysosporum bergii ANA360D TaxID=617107 RepID=A0AA43KCN3_9CYAN|nr:holdfast anchoring protein HfaA [Chrysosporum bergii]MDH6061646.1 holdfast anchoring protein HfaA [Chrysosporum bergii ANA360D]